MAVLVTGGTGALGTAVCEVLLARGEYLHVTYLAEHEVGRFVARLGPPDMPGGKSRYSLHRVDVTSEDEVENLFSTIENAKEPALRIDALVHLAGAFTYAPIEDTTLEAFESQMALNLRSTFLCARAAVRHMKPRGKGRIVAIGAKTAADPGPNLSAYAASKGGVLAMVRSLAEELRGTGISVYAVLPSLIDTPANRASGLDPSKMVAPTDIALVIASLLGDELAIATGALIPVYGK